MAVTASRKASASTALPIPTIPAAKNALGDEALYWLFARWSLWNFFSKVWLQTAGPLPHPQRGPFIFYLNHSSWWDGYLMMVIHRLVLQRRFDSYLMMEEKQLRAFRFFQWCGAFSINRRSTHDAAHSIAYISRLLRERQDRALYIFPQGRIVPSDQRPLVTYPGIAQIVAEVGNVSLCPVTLRYEFLGDQWPHVFVRVGPAHRPLDPGDPTSTLADITERMTESLDTVRDQVEGGDLSQFRVLLRGRPGIDATFARFLQLLPRRAKTPGQ